MNHYKIITILLLFFIINGCVKEIDYESLNYKPMLVLNGIIYQDSTVNINISKTKNILEINATNPFVSDATVNLYADDVFVEKLIYDSLGFYRSNTKTKSNINYRIEAEAAGMPKASGIFVFEATQSIKAEKITIIKKDTIFSVDKPIKKDTAITNYHVKFDITFQDNPNEKNYYDFSANGDFLSILNQGQFKDGIYTSQKWLKKENSAYIGFQNPYDRAKYFPEISGSYNGFSQNSYIKDDLFNGQKLTLSLQTYFNTNKSGAFTFELYMYPEILIKFNESGINYLNTYGGSFSQPVNIYSNVKNGLGFICGVSKCSVSISF